MTCKWCGERTRRYDALISKLEEQQRAAEAEVERLSTASLRRPALRPLAELRAAVAAEAAGATDVDAVRAALRARYERFVLHRGPVPQRLTTADAGALEVDDYFITMD